MQFALAAPARALLLPLQCFTHASNRLRGALTGLRRPCARDTARHCQQWCQFLNGTLASNLTSKLQQSNIELAEAYGFQARCAGRRLLERFGAPARKLAGFKVGKLAASSPMPMR